MFDSEVGPKNLYQTKMTMYVAPISTKHEKAATVLLAMARLFVVPSRVGVAPPVDRERHTDHPSDLSRKCNSIQPFRGWPGHEKSECTRRLTQCVDGGDAISSTSGCSESQNIPQPSHPTS